MNPFADLLNDTVYIESPDGRRSGPFKTNLRKDRATIFAQNLEASQGDILVHSLPHGVENVYSIESIRYTDGMMDVPASYTFMLGAMQASARQSPSEKNLPDTPHQEITTPLPNLRNILEDLIQEIEKSDGDNEQKIIAKSKIKEFMDNPIIASLIDKNRV